MIESQFQILKQVPMCMKVNKRNFTLQQKRSMLEIKPIKNSKIQMKWRCQRPLSITNKFQNFHFTFLDLLSYMWAALSTLKNIGNINIKLHCAKQCPSWLFEHKNVSICSSSFVNMDPEVFVIGIEQGYFCKTLTFSLYLFQNTKNCP
jgi:hypothetical protein